MPLAIETDQLCRRFGDRLAVDRVCLQVPTGAVYGFLGRNGAGKTTTLRLLLGLLRADSGSVRICGIDVARSRVLAARKVGVLLESHGLYAHLSGRENLDLSRRLLGLAPGEIDRVLDIAGLRAHDRRRVADYSLGMRQRLGLARALLGAPPVLILDEPSNGLDPEGLVEMRALLRELPARAGATVLLSSHLLDEIERTATHVGILSGGRLVRQGRLDSLRQSVDSELVIGVDCAAEATAFLRSRGFDAQTECTGVRVRIAAGHALEAVAAELNGLLYGAGLRVHTLMPRQLSLESLYRAAGDNSAGTSPNSVYLQ